MSYDMVRSISEALSLQWREYPIQPFEIDKPEEEAIAREDLRYLANLWHQINKGAEVYARDGIKATLQDTISSAVNIVKALVKADAIFLHPKAWGPDIKPFMDEVIQRIERQGYSIPIEESESTVPRLVPFVVTHDAISLVGSSVYENVEAGDRDWLIRSNDDLPLLESYINSSFKDKDNHFIYELKGPSSDYIPIGDFFLIPYVNILTESIDIKDIISKFNSVMVDPRYLNILHDTHPIKLRVNSNIEDGGLVIKLQRLFQVEIEVKFTQVPHIHERPIGKLTFVKFQSPVKVEINEPDFRPYYSRKPPFAESLISTGELLNKISPTYLQGVSNEDLASIHNTIHDAIGAFNFENLVNAHIFTVREMTKRGQPHPYVGDDIDIQSSGLTAKMHESDLLEIESPIMRNSPDKVELGKWYPPAKVGVFGYGGKEVFNIDESWKYYGQPMLNAGKKLIMEEKYDCGGDSNLMVFNQIPAGHPGEASDEAIF